MPSEISTVTAFEIVHFRLFDISMHLLLVLWGGSLWQAAFACSFQMVRHQNVAFLLPFRLFITNMHLFLFLSGGCSPTLHPFWFLSSLFIINMCLSFRLVIVNMCLVFKAVNSAIAGVWTFGISGLSFAYFIIIIVSQTMSSSITMACTHTLQTGQNVMVNPFAYTHFATTVDCCCTCQHAQYCFCCFWFYGRFFSSLFNNRQTNLRQKKAMCCIPSKIANWKLSFCVPGEANSSHCCLPTTIHPYILRAGYHTHGQTVIMCINILKRFPDPWDFINNQFWATSRALCESVNVS